LLETYGHHDIGALAQIDKAFATSWRRCGWSSKTHEAPQTPL
jgi:hypothetical protein